MNRADKARTHFSVGEVARRAGVTVRTLHHYDHIGLVCPSARSEAGYRLYSAPDMERLLAVQSLKRLGLGLEAIAASLVGGGPSPQALLAGQMAEVSRVLNEARALKDKLQFLQEAMAEQGATPTHLLDGIRLLETHQLFLPEGGVRQLLGRWRRARPRWQLIADALEQCRAEGQSVETAQVQLLAQRWMHVAMQVFGGRLRLVLDWARMHKEAPETALHAGLEPVLMAYLDRAIAVRLAALRRHLSTEELLRLDGSTGPEWEAFAAQGERLLARGILPRSKAARALKARYQELALRTMGQDTALAAKLAAAYAAEPVLTLGHFVSPQLRAYLHAVSA
ncbi:MAG: MerR family transcriptional regulator [Acidovorax sp.]|nr:MerR family transcriptional regulator [Acidovorax sp.]